MKKLRIGLGQLNTKNNIENSFREIENQTVECSSKGAQLVIFPEMSTYLTETSTYAYAQTLDGEITSRFKELAIKHKVYIHNGSFVEKSENNGKSYNTSVLINPKGDVEAIYRKIHLFDIERNCQVKKTGLICRICNLSASDPEVTLLYFYFLKSIFGSGFKILRFDSYSFLSTLDIYTCCV